ncbi:MAG: DUF1549 domain-containing protein [Planctomycetaceae bacterium]|nr:DUF1549 domain-containing protein [Planctomycetaceae bacterium]
MTHQRSSSLRKHMGCTLLASILWQAPAIAKDIDFAHDVVPILRQRCAECHGGSEAEGGFSLNTRALLLEADVVTPRQADESRILELVTSTDPDDQMPPKDRDRLTEKEMQLLKQWIDDGLPWEDGFTFAEERYEPPLLPRPVELPTVMEGRSNPIDRIIDAYRVEYGLPREVPIDDAAFMRRLTIDLVGLLPAPEELEAFVADDAVNKRQQLIDQTLAKDRDYAEHWITFWSDLLRNAYAGTGFIDGGRKQITGWLYGALLTNMPYNLFVRELIAPSPESEGFIKGIKWRGNVNSSQAPEIQFAQSVGQVLLGINLKCASCHDSFIDRWTLDETYNLAAVFSSKPLEVHRCDVPSGRFAEAAWIFPELGQVDKQAEQPERLRQLADLMTHPDNGRLTRTIVNRLWQRMMGRGIVDPVDAMQTEPWSADLLDYLALNLQQHNYDLKQTLSLIANSHAYQAQAVAIEDHSSSEQFVFQGPQTKRMTAEQFLDAIWQSTRTWSDPDGNAFKPDGRGQGGQLAAVLQAEGSQARIKTVDHLLTGDLIREVLQQSQWVWSTPDAATVAPPGVAHFRQTIEIPDAPHVLIVTAADNSAEVFLNGHRLGDSGAYDRVVILEATEHVTSGTNLIAVRGKNDTDQPNPAGLLLKVFGLSEDGKLQWVESESGQWVWSAETHSGWELTDFDASSWETAVVLGDASMAPWNLLATFDDSRYAVVHDWKSLWGDRPVRAALRPHDQLQATLGRPNREQVVSTRPSELTTLEAISLANGEDVSSLMQHAAENVLAQNRDDPDELINSLFLAALARPPSTIEHQVSLGLLGEPMTQDGVEDLLWAVFMLPEFHLIR